jgi:hypothetical protein
MFNIWQLDMMFFLLSEGAVVVLEGLRLLQGLLHLWIVGWDFLGWDSPLSLGIAKAFETLRA